MLFIYGVVIGVSVFVGGVVVLFVLWFFVGFGFGVELFVVLIYVSEFVLVCICGWLIVVLEVFWVFGWIVVVVIGFFVIFVLDDGWCWVFVLGVILVVYVLFVWWWMFELLWWFVFCGCIVEVDCIVLVFEVDVCVVIVFVICRELVFWVIVVMVCV